MRLRTRNRVVACEENDNVCLQIRLVQLPTSPGKASEAADSLNTWPSRDLVTDSVKKIASDDHKGVELLAVPTIPQASEFQLAKQPAVNGFSTAVCEVPTHSIQRFLVQNTTGHLHSLLQANQRVMRL